MLKSVGTRGRLTLGKRYAGTYFEVEERPNGEILLRPVRPVGDVPATTSAAAEPPRFEIADVEQVILPSREERMRL